MVRVQDFIIARWLVKFHETDFEHCNLQRSFETLRCLKIKDQHDKYSKREARGGSNYFERTWADSQFLRSIEQL